MSINTLNLLSSGPNLIDWFFSALLPTEAVYLTMTDVKIKLPYLRNNIEGVNRPLVTLYALNDNRFTDHTNFRYSLKSEGANLLQINSVTGDITLREKDIHASKSLVILNRYRFMHEILQLCTQCPYFGCHQNLQLIKWKLRNAVLAH